MINYKISKSLFIFFEAFTKIHILSSFLIVCSLTSCTWNKDNPSPPSLSDNYPSEIGSIITTSCAIDGCHKGENAPENLDLSTWEKLFEGSEFGAIAIPYEDQWSHLFQHMNTFEDLGIRATPVMPPTPSDPIERKDVIQIQEWLKMGAPDKEGNIMWADKEAIGNGKLFSLCAGSDLVAVTDLASNLVMRFIQVGRLEQDLEAPHYIRISPDGAFFYVTLINGAIVEKYRTDNYEFVSRVEIGPDPALIEISPDGERMVVSHWNDTGGQPKLTMIKTADMSILGQVIAGGDVLSFPHGMAAMNDYKTLLVVANQGNYYSKIGMSEQGFVSETQIPIDPDNSPIPQASVAYKPYHCFLSPDEKTFYISCNITDEVRAFDTETDELIAVIPTGDFPRLMDYDPVNQHLYVACANEENASQQGSLKGCVSVIDMKTNSFVQNIYQLGHRPHGISVDANARLMYVSSENVGGVDPPHHPTGDAGPPGKYNVVDLNSLTVLKNMETEVAVFPNALVVNP